MWAEVLLNLDQAEAKKAIEKDNDFDLLKATYRQSEIFHHFLPMHGAREALDNIKKRGYLVTILTSRNPDKNPKIKTITKKWLNKHKFQYDSIVFAKDKSDYIKKNEGRIIMVIEDDPEILDSFGKLKTEIVMFRNDLNRDIKQPNFHAVASWKEVGSLFESLIAK